MFIYDCVSTDFSAKLPNAYYQVFQRKANLLLLMVLDIAATFLDEPLSS